MRPSIGQHSTSHGVASVRGEAVIASTATIIVQLQVPINWALEVGVTESVATQELRGAKLKARQAALLAQL